jgi:hypothetical protein
MRKWEYLGVEMYSFGSRIILDGQLVAEHSSKSSKGPAFRVIANLLGEQGWEMTGIISVTLTAI